MRKQRKDLILGVVFCLILLLSVPVYASEDQTNAASFVTISGDLDFSDEKVSTFYEERTVSGTAPEGTKITITTYKKGFIGRLKEQDSFEMTVGSAGVFSQIVPLRIGENVVVFQVAYEDEMYEATLTVNRKKQEIKLELENAIFLPGGYE